MTKVMTTDIIGQPYGMVKVVGSREEVRALMTDGAGEDAVDFLAFAPDGNHIPVTARRGSINLIGREEELEVFSPEEVKAATEALSGLEGLDTVGVGG